MKIAVKIDLEDEQLNAEACQANALRIGVAIMQLRTMQETWKTVARKLKSRGLKRNGGHNRT